NTSRRGSAVLGGAELAGVPPAAHTLREPRSPITDGRVGHPHGVLAESVDLPGQDNGGTWLGTAPALTNGQTSPVRRTHRQRAGEVPHRRQTPHRHRATTVHR